MIRLNVVVRVHRWAHLDIELVGVAGLHRRVCESPEWRYVVNGIPSGSDLVNISISRTTEAQRRTTIFACNNHEGFMSMREFEEAGAVREWRK